VHLEKPSDVTLYLNDPQQMFLFPNVNPWVISVGNGGTSFDYVVGKRPDGSGGESYSCVRGQVLHFVTDQLIVRSTTDVFGGLVLPAIVNSQRFMAEAGIGRPTEFQRTQWHTVNNGAGDPEMEPIALSPWSTYARLDPNIEVGAATNYSGLFVRQVNHSPAPVGDSDLNRQPFSNYTVGKGVPLHPWANRLVVETPGGGVYSATITETFQH
jgi:hypothetical protein